MLPESLILASRTAFIVGDMRSSIIRTLWLSFIFARAVFL